MEFLRNWIINIVATMIFVTFIQILIPEGSMRRYINLVVGLLVMIVILSPLLSVVSGGFDMGERILEMSRAIDIRDVQLKVANFEEGQRENIVMIYRERLEREVVKQLTGMGLADRLKAEVEIDDAYGTEGFGSIKGIRIVILGGVQGTAAEGVVKVENVEVRVDAAGDSGVADTASGERGRREQEIKDYLAHLYGIPQEDIDVVSYKQDR